MFIKKKADTYNTYVLEISWAQLQAFRQALENDHADPVRDETMAELAWYMDHVPGPGVDEKEYEAQQKGNEGNANGEAGAAEEDGDLPIPMPPGSKAGTPPDGGKKPTPPPEGGETGLDRLMQHAHKSGNSAQPALPEFGEEPTEEAPEKPGLRAGVSAKPAEQLPEPPAE